MSRPSSQQDVKTLIRRFSDLSSMSSSSDSENVIPHPLSTMRKLSPARKPLHERSKSEANERPSPTIRIVEDSDSEIYAKAPFPNQPSQVLAPRKTHAGYAFDGRGSPKPRVSDSSSTTLVSGSEFMQPADTLVPKPLQLRRNPDRTSGSTCTSDADTVTDTSSIFPVTNRFSQDTSPPTSPRDKDIHDSGVGGLDIVPEEHPVADPPTVRAVEPNTSIPLRSPLRTSFLAQKPSDNSLASSTSTDTLILHYQGGEQCTEERSGSSSSNLVPPPGAAAAQPRKPKYTYPRSKKRAGPSRVNPKRPILKASSESLADSEKSRTSSDYPPSSSQSTAHVAFQEPAQSSSSVQYPTVRPAYATSSRATSGTVPTPATTRMGERLAAHPWSSQLSVIASESHRDSQTPSQTSFRTQDLRSLSAFRSNPSVVSVAEEDEGLYLATPEPSYSPIRPGRRDSDEHYDTIAELQPHALKKQHSGRFLRRHSSESRPGSSRGSWRPSSSGSNRPSSAASNISYFVASTIPAWARYYYRNNENPALAAPDSSTEATESRAQSMYSDGDSHIVESYFPMNIYRPRNRPRPQSDAQRDSMAISVAPAEEDLYVVGRPRRIVTEPFTPRLMRDRRSHAILSPWPAPSFDSNYGTLAWTKGNRQVLMFILGFIFPPAWILAAILPLPESPAALNEKATQREQEIQAQIEHSFGPADEYRYLKARWWRNLNRIMSVVGVAMIVTIIVLAVFAAGLL